MKSDGRFVNFYGLTGTKMSYFLTFLWVFILFLAPYRIDSKDVGKDRVQKMEISSNSNQQGIEQVEDALPMDDEHLLAGPLPHQNISFDHLCTCHSSAYHNSEIPTSCRNKNRHNTSEHCGARIFYFIGIHNNRTLQDALYLFRGIRDARNTILIHLDVKFGMDAYYNSSLYQEIEACPCGSTVEVASIHNCSWGSWSMNLPTLWSMEKAVEEYAGKWDVYINLSGDTLPVYTQDRIAELFAGPLNGINFVTSNVCETGLRPTPVTAFPKKWHKRMHYSHKPADNLEFVDDDGIKHHNVSLEIYFGSQWMALTPSWCDFLIRQLKRQDSLTSRFKEYLVKTGKLMSDETFIPTLLMIYFPETIPNVTSNYFLDRSEVLMYAIRYERMDEHVPSSSGWYPTEQRYEVPKSTGIEKPRPWGPYFLGTYDLNNIRISGALFIRKVATMIDPNMYRILPVDDPEDIPPISWPKEVQLSPVPDWEKTVTEYKKLAQEKLDKQKADQKKKEEGSSEDEEEEILDDDGNQQANIDNAMNHRKKE